MKKEKKVYVGLKLWANGKSIVEYLGDLKADELELLDDVLSIVWHFEPADKKALKKIKEVVLEWNKEMVND